MLPLHHRPVAFERAGPTRIELASAYADNVPASPDAYDPKMCCGRGGETRTRDLVVPNHAYWPLYYATKVARGWANIGAPSWNRTNLLRASTGCFHQGSYRSSYRRSCGQPPEGGRSVESSEDGSPWGSRTPVLRLKASDPDRWTNGPEVEPSTGVEPAATSLRERHPTVRVPMAHGRVLAARAGFEPAVARLTGGCLSSWLPCNVKRPGRGRSTEERGNARRAHAI